MFSLVLCILAAPSAQEPTPAAPRPTLDRCADSLARFREAAQRLTRGDESARTALSAQAAQLAAECGRTDAVVLAAYLSALSQADLAAGAAVEARWLEVRATVDALAQAELEPEEWHTRRAELLERLDRIADDGGRLADCAPAAHARSFAARLRVEQLERDRSLDAPAQSALAEHAQQDVRASLATLERAGQVAATLEPRWLAGRLSRARGARAEARAQFEQVAADAELVGSDAFREHALLGLVTLARDLGDVGEEERLLLEIARFRSPKDSWPLARDWASWLVMSEHAPTALDFLERNAPDEADLGARYEWDLLIGAAAMRNGELDLSRRHLESARSRGDTSTIELALARLSLREGRVFETLDRLENSPTLDGLDPLEASEALSLRGEAHWSARERDLALADLGSALATADAWDRGLDIDPIDGASQRAVRNVVGEWLGVHSLACYAAVAAESGDTLEAARAIEEFQSRSLRRGARELDRLRAIAGAETALTRDDLAAWAKSFELGLITWVIGPDFSVCVHIAQDGRASFARIERTRAEIEDAGRRLREAWIAGDGAAAARWSRELGDALFPSPIRSALTAESTSPARILLCLHGPLEGLAIESLTIGESTLDERCVAVCVPGLVAARPPILHANSSHWSFIGAPDSSPLGELAGAKSELEELARGTPGSTAAIGAACDRAALTRAVSAPGSLHIATHLALAPQSSRGRFAPVGLQLSNVAVFSALDVRELARPLDLVVLSSCSSACGRELDGEGLQGLARAFLETGSTAVVATLWPVSDRGAREFAVALHRRIAAGDRPAAAVRSARAQLRLGGVPAADWAAFRALGL